MTKNCLTCSAQISTRWTYCNDCLDVGYKHATKEKGLLTMEEGNIDRKVRILTKVYQVDQMRLNLIASRELVTDQSSIDSIERRNVEFI